MTANWLFGLSNWNPQFFRELKGRLKPRNVALTAATSLMMQLVVLLYFWGALPGAETRISRYCTGKVNYAQVRECILNVAGNPPINWQLWWSDMFQVFSWVLPFILLIAGVYMLVGDLAKEERRGTLNFIRLSPQTSQQILIGKILGVPAVPYLFVALAVPLHLLAAIGAAMPAKIVLSIYLLAIANCLFFYTGSLLYAFLGGFQGWVGAVAVWFSYTVFFQLWQTSQSYAPKVRYLFLGDWFHISIGSHLGLTVGFALVTLGVGTYWIWQALNRRFRNPNITLLSKKQSYLVTACFEVWMFGFVFREMNSWDRPLHDLMALTFFNLIWFVLLIAALTPQRQTLLDWARYRRERVSNSKRFWSQSIVKDLVWGEKSPSVVAIAINLLITLTIFTPWILTWDQDETPLRAFAMMLLGVTFMVICATIAQLMMFMKSQKRAIWAATTISALIILPPIVLTMLTFYPHEVPAAWLLSAFAFVAIRDASVTTIFLSLLGHLSILSLLTTRMAKQLRKAGESESKALLASSRG